MSSAAPRGGTRFAWRAPLLSILLALVVALPAPFAVATHEGPQHAPNGNDEFTDNYYHEFLVYNMDTTDLDVVILPPAGPLALRNVQLLKQGVESWAEGIDALGASWLSQGLDIDVYVFGLDHIPPDVLWDPEIIIIAAEPFPFVRTFAGIGLEPMGFLGPYFCHGQPLPDPSEIGSAPDFHRHDGSPWGMKRAECESGGSTCFVVNASWFDTGSSANMRDMYDLNSHEVGHCLGIGHVGDALDFTAAKYPRDDIMSYENDRHNPGYSLCPSTLNMEALEFTYAHLLGQAQPRNTAGGYVHMAPADWRDHDCAEPTATPTDTGPVEDADPLGLNPPEEEPGTPTIIIEEPADGAEVPQGPVPVSGTVDREGGGAGAPLSASIVAPAQGNPGQDIPIQGNANGGASADGFTCAWSDDSGASSYADATACSTTVNFPAEGDFTLTVTVDDGTGTAQATHPISIAEPSGLPEPDGSIAGGITIFSEASPVAFNELLAFGTAEAGDPAPKFLPEESVVLHTRFTLDNQGLAGPGGDAFTWHVWASDGTLVDTVPCQTSGDSNSLNPNPNAFDCEPAYTMPADIGRYYTTLQFDADGRWSCHNGEPLLGLLPVESGIPDCLKAFDVVVRDDLEPPAGHGDPGQSGSASDPEVTDPEGDYPLSHMDITKAWIENDNPTTFDVFLQVKDLDGGPQSTPVLAFTYGLDFCTNHNLKNGAAICYRYSAQNAVTGPTFDGGVVNEDGSSCSYPNLLVSGAIDAAANTVRWRIPKDQLNFNDPPASINDCTDLATKTWSRTGGPVVDGTLISLIKGSTGIRAGFLVTVTLSEPGVLGGPEDDRIFGDGTPSGRDYTIGQSTPPLVAQAGGPYTGPVDTPIALTGSFTGGDGTGTCAWTTAADGAFADASLCAATVTFSSAGSKSVTLTVTDGTGSASDDASVTVSGGATAERVEIYDGAELLGSLFVTSTPGGGPSPWGLDVDLDTPGAVTITAKWFDADVESSGAPLATASVDIIVQEIDAAFVRITSPANDGDTVDPPTTFEGTFSTDGEEPIGSQSSSSSTGPTSQSARMAPLVTDPTYAAAVAQLQDLTGYLAAVPLSGLSHPALDVALTGPVPADAPTKVAGWALHYLPHQQPKRMTGEFQGTTKVVSIEEAVESLRTHRGASSPQGPYLPLLSADGIGPGSPLVIPVGGNSFGLCSASYVFQDPATLTYYLSTAGHCLLKAESGPATTGAGSPSLVWGEIRICVEFCVENWNAIGGEGGPFGDTVYVSLKAAPGYHPVAFAQAQGIGLDFGLIEIPASAEPLLRFFLPQWGGPTSFDEPELGQTLVHFGHGVYCCPLVALTRLPTDQGRIALSFGNDTSGFTAMGDLSGGDSGSATGTGNFRASKMLLGDGAVGVNTHGIIVDHVPLFFGTLLSQGAEMAAMGGLDGLQLVNEDGILVPVLPPGPPPPEAAFTGPAEGTEVAQGSLVEVSGTATFPTLDPEIAYYLHRAACGEEDDGLRMDTIPSLAPEGGDGCGDALGAIGLVWEQAIDEVVSAFPAPAPGTDILLDAARAVEVEVYFTGFLFEPIQPVRDLEARLFTGSTLVASGRVTEVAALPGRVTFDLEITGPTTLPTDQPLTFALVEHESLGPMFFQYGGAHLSQIRLPLATPPSKMVQVSVDDPGFAEANLLAVTGTEDWTAQWSVGAIPVGAHTLHARALQGAGVQPTPATRSVTVLSGVTPPTADFSFTVDGLSVQFTDASTAGSSPISAWAWSFGDDGTSSDASPAHTYAADGTYTVSLTVTDEVGGTDSISQDVTVAAPVEPWQVRIRLLDPDGQPAIDWTTVAAGFDGDAGAWSHDWVPASGPTPGTFLLEAELLREGELRASTVRSFIVEANLPPTIDDHEDVTAEADGPEGAVVAYAPPATHDDRDGDGVATCEPGSGSLFPLGSTTVHCNATDSDGNPAEERTFRVHVVDSTAPTLHLPEAVDVTATSRQGAAATFTATATDQVDGSVPVTCAPASGSNFPLGQTTVDCSATDSQGNTAVGTFPVTVTYSWSGFLKPNPDGSSSFKAGKKVDATFKLTGPSAGITDAAAFLFYTPDGGGEAPATTNKGGGTNAFSYRPGLKDYAISWDTKDLAPGGYTLRADLGDGVVRTVRVNIT